jgi:hypothetical protein
MPYYQSTYRSKVYRDFKEIERSAYRRIIRYFEDHEEEIKKLDFEEFFEVLVAYVNSLFEVGKYQKHLLMVDLVIEESIRQNIEIFHGEDIFKKMLFRKAASLYNIREFNRADYILREIVKIDPANEDAVLFLKKCLCSRMPPYVQQTRAAGIFLILLTAFLYFLEELFIRPFFEMHAGLVETAQFSAFALGCLALLGGDLFHRWSVEREVDEFVKKAWKAKGEG